MAEGVLDQVQKGVNAAGEVVDIVLRTKTGQALDEKLANEINPLSGYEILHEQMPKMADAIDENTGKVVDAVGGIIVECIETIYKKIKKELKKDHGSKVKVGRFYGCSIVDAGTKSCIVVDKEKHEVVYLTPENVSLSRYVKKRFDPLRGKKYYYYELIFKDGSESYVRVSKKHRQNLDHCGLQSIETSIFKELPSGEEYEDDEE